MKGPRALGGRGPASSHFRRRGFAFGVEPDERRARWRHTSAPDTGPRRTSPITLLSTCVAPFSFWSVLSKACHLAILKGTRMTRVGTHTPPGAHSFESVKRFRSARERRPPARVGQFLTLCIWCVIRRHAHISIRHSHLLAHTSEHRLSSYLSAAVPNECARS